MRRKDLEPGRRFGRLTVICRSEDKTKVRSWFTCKCDCGTVKDISYRCLITRSTISCGCYKAEQSSKRMKTHGLTKHPLYLFYRNLVKKCREKDIELCDRWRNSVQDFIDDVGIPPGNYYSLYRIDPNKGYSPDNFEWRLTFLGKMKTKKQWL